MIGKLIGGLVTILIGVSLIGPINTEVNNFLNTNTFPQGIPPDSYGATVLKFVPGFFALGMLGIGIAICWSALKGVGLVGDRGGLEDKTTRYSATGWTSDVYGTMDEAQALAEVRKATEPPKYYKESQLREIERKYKPNYNENQTKFD